MKRYTTGKVHELGRKSFVKYTLLLNLAIPELFYLESDETRENAPPRDRSCNKFPRLRAFLVLYDIHMARLSLISRSALHSNSKLDNTLPSSDTLPAFCVQLLDILVMSSTSRADSSLGLHL